jgi:hypothetical protein
MHALGLDYHCVAPRLLDPGCYAADLAVSDEDIRKGRIAVVYDQSAAYESVSRWLVKCFSHLSAHRFLKFAILQYSRFPTGFNDGLRM